MSISDVRVAFIDGSVQDYVITAGVGIAASLARTAGETGILSLFNASEQSAYCIPLVQIRGYSIAQRDE